MEEFNEDMANGSGVGIAGGERRRVGANGRDGYGYVQQRQPGHLQHGQTGSKTLPPEGTKNPGIGTAENPLKNTLQGIYNRCVAATKKRDEPCGRSARAGFHVPGRER